MLAPSSDLMRAALALKLNRVKRAARSYARDRANQATGSVTSYAIAAGLFAASAIFLIAAALVGLTALFRWVEIRYGLFPAFAVIGGLLLAIAIICAALAAARLRRRPAQFPSLTSRLRVAITANPLKPAQTPPVRNGAASPMAASAEPLAGTRRPGPAARPVLDNRQAQAGLIFAAALLGWAAVRRKSRKRRIDV